MIIWFLPSPHDQLEGIDSECLDTDSFSLGWHGLEKAQENALSLFYKWMTESVVPFLFRFTEVSFKHVVFEHKRRVHLSDAEFIDRTIQMLLRSDVKNQIEWDSFNVEILIARDKKNYWRNRWCKNRALIYDPFIHIGIYVYSKQNRRYEHDQKAEREIRRRQKLVYADTVENSIKALFR